MAQVTTYGQILDQWVSSLAAIVPTKQSQVRFLMHREASDFVPWVEQNPDACFRRVEIGNEFDYQMNGVSDGSIWEVIHHATVQIAYPQQWGKYGPNNQRDADVLIDSDIAQIDKAIGLSGYPSQVAGHATSQRVAMVPVKVTGAWILQMRFELRYDRSY